MSDEARRGTARASARPSASARPPRSAGTGGPPGKKKRPAGSKPTGSASTGGSAGAGSPSAQGSIGGGSAPAGGRLAGRPGIVALPARVARRALRVVARIRPRPRPATRRRGTMSLDVPLETRRAVLPTPQVDPEVFGRGSERFARFMGTAQFIAFMTAFVALWLGWNTFGPSQWQFDPRALNYTLLTLILSLQASYAAPLILLAQNRQADRDRVSFEQDRQRSERNLADTEYLAREVAALRIALRDVATRDFLRSELRDLLEELAEARDDDPAADGGGRSGKSGGKGTRGAGKAKQRKTADKPAPGKSAPAEPAPAEPAPASGEAAPGQVAATPDSPEPATPA